jgi:hypothetical protein
MPTCTSLTTSVRHTTGKARESLTDVGQRDFFGNPIPSPAGGDYDIGAHEFALEGERRIDLLYLLFWAGSQNRSAQLIAYG